MESDILLTILGKHLKEFLIDLWRESEVWFASTFLEERQQATTCVYTKVFNHALNLCSPKKCRVLGISFETVNYLFEVEGLILILIYLIVERHKHLMQLSLTECKGHECQLQDNRWLVDDVVFPTIRSLAHLVHQGCNLLVLWLLVSSPIFEDLGDELIAIH